MQLKQKEISQRIRWIMHNLNLNQHQLAQQLRITQPAVSKYLLSRIPPPAVLLRLAQLADTTVDWILTGRKESTQGKVAEKGDVYKATLSLTDNFQSLPFEVQDQLNNFIDVLTQHVKNKKI
jgi:transcriptional regulator with XRE-family HTH domain